MVDGKNTTSLTLRQKSHHNGRIHIQWSIRFTYQMSSLAHYDTPWRRQWSVSGLASAPGAEPPDCSRVQRASAGVLFPSEERGYVIGLVGIGCLVGELERLGLANEEHMGAAGGTLLRLAQVRSAAYVSKSITDWPVTFAPLLPSVAGTA